MKVSGGFKPVVVTLLVGTFSIWTLLGVTHGEAVRHLVEIWVLVSPVGFIRWEKMRVKLCRAWNGKKEMRLGIRRAVENKQKGSK